MYVVKSKILLVTEKIKSNKIAQAIWHQFPSQFYALSGGVLRCVASLDPFCWLVGKIQRPIRMSQIIIFFDNTESKTEHPTQKCNKICAWTLCHIVYAILFILFMTSSEL